jgi:hypothetical protein
MLVWKKAMFDDCHAYVGYWDGMDIERTIDEIEQLEEMFEAPDIRPLNPSDLAALNRQHDETLGHLKELLRVGGWHIIGQSGKTKAPQTLMSHGTLVRATSPRLLDFRLVCFRGHREWLVRATGRHRRAI